MKSERQVPAPQGDSVWPTLFAGLLGALLGLCLLKFGNPPITEKYVIAPTTFWEFLLGYPWPIAWAYRLLALVAVIGLIVALRSNHRWTQRDTDKISARPRSPRAGVASADRDTSQSEPNPESGLKNLCSSVFICGYLLLALPLVWLVWQFVAGTQSVDHSLTSPTLKHFTAGVLCFYLGYFSLTQVRQLGAFWLGLVVGFQLVLLVGWEQQFGGLRESRHYFFLYVYPYMTDAAPEYLKKISSNRIFSTLFYPNTLAGVLLLLLPATLAAIWRLRGLLTAAARGFLISLVATAGLACLYWSGSKGGWLLMLLLGLIALLRLPFKRQLKVGLVTLILLTGLVGFFWRYSSFFQKGATSVGARFDYWRAAVQTASEHPLFGTGPGTFAIAYQKTKRPESEMARLTHNDYLEQASDSGLVGLFTYVLFIVGALVRSYPKTSQAVPAGTDGWLTFAVWLGVLGWTLQSLLEFGLYIPALAWPAFCFLGWLLGQKRSRSVANSPPT
jgi:O-antigen ligase